MPSPVGHALGALAIGWTVAGVPGGRRALWLQAVLLVALGVAPDLDLLVGRHRVETHSLGSALIVAGLAALGRWPLATTVWRMAAAAGLAWGSHALLDALGADSSEPFGVMAGWPVSQTWVHLADFFPSIQRRWWRPGFVTANLWAVAVELVVLGPVTWAVWRWRRPTPRRR